MTHGFALAPSGGPCDPLAQMSASRPARRRRCQPPVLRRTAPAMPGATRPKVLLAPQPHRGRCTGPTAGVLIRRGSRSGWSGVWHLIWRSLTAQLLWNTVRLTVVVTLICAVIGTLAAYGVERTTLPGATCGRCSS